MRSRALTGWRAVGRWIDDAPDDGRGWARLMVTLLALIVAVCALGFSGDLTIGTPFRIWYRLGSAALVWWAVVWPVVVYAVEPDRDRERQS